MSSTDTPAVRDGAVPAGAATSQAFPDVVVRTRAPAAGAVQPASRGGAFLSVVVVVGQNIAQDARDLEQLEAALADAYPVHEIVVVVPRGEASADWARDLAATRPNLQVLGLLHPDRDEIAYTAGLDSALGDVVVTARLGVDPPAEVLRCAALVRSSNGVVVGVDQNRARRSSLPARLARSVASRSLGLELPSVSLTLRGFPRSALDAWLPRRDRDKVLRMLPAFSGYPYTVMPYASAGAGRGHYLDNGRQVVRSMFYVSARPLRAAVGLALAASTLNVLYALYVVVVGIFSGAVEGWTSMSLQMSLMFFLLGVVIAIMAEFMYQSHVTANEHPIYRVSYEATSPVLGAREALNVEAAASAVQEEPGVAGSTSKGEGN
ncbi:glycosyltransferase family protein [Motilibacter deserti]|uniref:Glycosyltransferase involved in cell wall biosynthesis n=1 Tax=Motilibacter deserti TaxID=2714956 RepID=A0ABX0H0M0_9ACTN|nr:hypothetical protein [Motilibacter deserti]NHC15525.1 hypothetical protein [Motilibacter deserti]